MRTIKDLILRMQPYPKELKEWCRLNSDFENALKIIHPVKFISLGAVIVSHCPLIPDDEIIGFLTYDYEKNIFKQDFIVNIGSKNKEFIIYTRYKGVGKNKYIRDISHFYQKYTTYDKRSHHPSFEDIPDTLKQRALESIKLAKRIKTMGLNREITDFEYARIDVELRKLNL